MSVRRLGVATESVLQGTGGRITLPSWFARWVLRVAVFLIPLAFLPTIVDEFVLPKLLLARLLILLMAIVLVAGWLGQGAVTWKRTALDLPLLAFVGSAGISSIFAVNRYVAIFGTYDRWEGLLTITTYALLFWLAVQLISGEGEANGLTWSLLISGYIIAGVAVLQSAFGVLGGGYSHVPGDIRADSTMANPDFLGIFLAMLLPVAFAKLTSARSGLIRLLSANLVVVLALGLLATFTIAAWIGAVIGVVIVLALSRRRFHPAPLVAFAAALVLGLAALAGIVTMGLTSAQGGIAQTAYSRILSVANPSSISTGGRLAVWKDTLPLIATRPLVGYGPDTFGLVFGQFQTTNTSGAIQWDKPHEEFLGVLATQGVIGFLAYIWILVGFVRAFWSGRRQRGAIAVFAGWVAYEVPVQVDFSWIPAAVPFWIFAAISIVIWAPNVRVVRVAALPRRIAIPVLAAGSVALVALAIPAVVMPYMADADYYSAQGAATHDQARATIAQARALAPNIAAYAVEAGNYALHFDQNLNPSPDADWVAAREAFETADRLGSYSPQMFRDLAMVDEHLGDNAGALAAARKALSLDRFDKDSQALVARLAGR